MYFRKHVENALNVLYFSMLLMNQIALRGKERADPIFLNWNYTKVNACNYCLEKS